MTVLHVASWYPNPWNEVEGNFVRDHVRLFSQEILAETVVVQVRYDSGVLLRLQYIELEDGVRGYFLLTRFGRDRVKEWLSAILLMAVLLRERAWRFELFHFHIAYPLLLNIWLWRWFLPARVMISEHWSAYHFNFFLPEGSKALKRLRRPFKHGFPVIAVSGALLDDIRRFSRREDFIGYVLPNVVPLHGASAIQNSLPVLFAVNRWVDIKDPLPMLEGLAGAVEGGAEFRLVLGGFGDLTDQMEKFVMDSALVGCTVFLGRMTKAEIACQLRGSDGYLFSSRYETFSVACAEALGAGVPLVGPRLSAIEEYASADDWEVVKTRDKNGWEEAVVRFLEWNKAKEFDRSAIAERAAGHFDLARLRASYRVILASVLPEKFQ